MVQSTRVASAIETITLMSVALAFQLIAVGVATGQEQVREIRVGIIGLDTSHAIHFTKLLNSPSPSPPFAKCRVVCAYPHGSDNIESSTSRVAGYTQQVREMGVEIVDSIDELVDQVDAVLLESNDGRPHLRQALPVLKAGKPLFIDKPMAASLADVVTIFDASSHFHTPVFSSSALRFGQDTQAVRKGSIGEVLACDASGPCDLEPTHPDLAWYGVHGVEALFTVMGPDCRTVTRIHSPKQDVVVGSWNDGRLGIYRGMRNGISAHTGLAYGLAGNQPMGSNPGYEPLLESIVAFFRGADPPVSPRETIDIFAFIEAADRSKQLGGATVSVDEIVDAARHKAASQRSW